MKKLIALALSTAVIALPSPASARDRHHDGGWVRNNNYSYSYDRHHDGGARYRNYGYRNYSYGYPSYSYGYSYPGTRTVISVGYPGYGYYGGGYPGGYYGGPYYSGAVVAYGDGWHRGWRHREGYW